LQDSLNTKANLTGGANDNTVHKGWLAIGMGVYSFKINGGLK